MRTIIIAGAALLSGACATTGAPVPPDQAAIPFVSTTGVLEWRVLDDRTLFIRGATNDWYRVVTAGPCPRLRTANSLGFVTTGGGDELDRFGAILAEGFRCQLQSVTRSGEPPAEARG